jgi:hypothetical protein
VFPKCDEPFKVQEGTKEPDFGNATNVITANLPDESKPDDTEQRQFQPD